MSADPQRLPERSPDADGRGADLQDPAAEDAIQEAVDSVLDEAEGRPAPPPVRVADEETGEGATPPWAEKLVRFLDDGVRVPGTEFRFGADGIIGLIFPGFGDFITGTGSGALLFLALRERVPTVVIGRMVFNILLDTLLGSIPVVGDVFDIFWKSNRKNLDLIERYRDDPEAKPSAVDYLLVATGLLLILVSIVLPFVLFGLLTGAGIFAVDSLAGE
jgi:hypothetical protein